MSVPICLAGSREVMHSDTERKDFVDTIRLSGFKMFISQCLIQFSHDCETKTK